ncbi:extracellular solute-binding protein [Streptomyces sp. RS10V-4]|uniref:ABC transporter substrate-binding protein n=1 Tax=Streptomyces rhizoryzae TaxID=2932493 RepID=UPI002005B6FA|nr:extracellular solute-binding protein [Streptomyces rhizoryzae]MCK7621646.1 extracellular solute-binding protein [Streptomyces rhizoryzae]
MKLHVRTVSLACSVVVAAVGLSACGASGGAGVDGSSKAATTTSAKDFGGMDALVAAAKKEGKLNAIALPRDWANYGEIIDTFEKKYGIKVEVENPSGSSQDEISAVTSRKGQDRSPDVIDVGSSFAMSAAGQNLLAPYQVSAFGQIPKTQKDPQARWYNDFGGYVSIGCDAARVKKCPKTFAELLDPQYKGQVALTGNPTKSASAFGAVLASALADKGSYDNVKPGLDFFARLKKSGNFNPVESSPATIQKGETPISITWDYLNTGYADQLRGKGVNWKVSIPTDGVYANYYSQAIVKWAPHPAAARLWQEFLYSPEGQNLWLKGYSRPVLMPSMKQAGTLDTAAAAKLPQVPRNGASTFPTEGQLSKAKQDVAQGWSQAVAG